MNPEIKPQFFFDTAEPKEVKQIWRQLESEISSDSVLGATTNPNALDRVKVHTLSALEQHILSLSQLITEIRHGSGGVIFVQIPNSQMTRIEMQTWINYISNLGDGQTRIGVKLTPHFIGVTNSTGLKVAQANKDMIETNITGVADQRTAIHAFRFNPDYVSLIYGRIRDRGGDPRAEFSWTENIRSTSKAGGRIIGGSLRDLETLTGCISTGAIPTIGFKAFDQILHDVTPDQFSKLWRTPRYLPPVEAPKASEEQLKLTLEFFAQMDALGQLMLADFRTHFGLRS